MDLKNMSWDKQSQNVNKKRLKLAILDVWSSYPLGPASGSLCLLVGKVLMCAFCVKSAEKPLASLRKKGVLKILYAWKLLFAEKKYPMVVHIYDVENK